MRALDLFAGLGGWDELIPDALGIEHDPYATATRTAVGLNTWRADIAALDPADFPVDEVLVGSPPCQGFSTAGKQDPNDPRNALVEEPMRWVRRWRPAVVALEQVPPVLPIWQRYAEEMRELGYSAWAGILRAEQYGVPQARRRAILMASREREVRPPEPLFEAYDPFRPGALSLFAPPPISMAEAIQVGPHRPAWTVTGGGVESGGGVEVFNSWARTAMQYRPATTIVATFSPDRLTPPGHRDWSAESGKPRQTGGVRITLAEALILQGFPPDYPVQGPKSRQFLQVGNAIPPPLANAILAALGVPNTS